jgi:cytoskeletal protein RodZ
MTQQLQSIWTGEISPTLGDEIRGVRYRKGLSVEQVANDLKLKPAYIDAIENNDLKVFPSRAFISGYVRSYAKYLDLDADQILKRFYKENKIQTTIPQNAHKSFAKAMERDGVQKKIFGIFDRAAVVKYSLVSTLSAVVLLSLMYIGKTLFLTPTEMILSQPADDTPSSNTFFYDVVESVKNHSDDSVSYDDLTRTSVSQPGEKAVQDGPISAIQGEAPPATSVYR